MDLKQKDSVLVPVWDVPLRLFHGLLVFAVAAAYVTAELGGSLIDWHEYFGLMVLGLLIFRLIWGFTGSLHARFADARTDSELSKRRLAQLRTHASRWFSGVRLAGNLSVCGRYRTVCQ